MSNRILLQKLEEEISSGKFCLSILSDDIRFSCLANCAKCCSYNILFHSSEHFAMSIESGDFESVTEDVRLLKMKDDDSCPFLNENLCSRYHDRPYICHSYPFFKFDDIFIYDASCPGIGKGDVITIAALRDKLPDFSKLYDLKASVLVSLIENE